MERFSAKNLYIVRPSVVVYNKTKIVKEDLKEFKTHYYQTIKLEQRPENIDIVSINDNFIHSISNDYGVEIASENYEFGKRYIGVNEKDKVLLVKYLCKLQFKNFIYTKGLQDFFINLKPEYTKEELIKLLGQIKGKNNDDTIKVKKIVKTYSKKIPCGFHII